MMAQLNCTYMSHLESDFPRTSVPRRDEAVLSAEPRGRRGGGRRLRAVLDFGIGVGVALLAVRRLFAIDLGDVALLTRRAVTLDDDRPVALRIGLLAAAADRTDVLVEEQLQLARVLPALAGEVADLVGVHRG